MSGGADLFHSLFHFPGEGPDSEHRLLALAAAAHGRIFMACRRRGCTGDAGHVIEAFLKGPANPLAKRRLLDTPLFIQALHAIAAEQAGFFEWGPREFARPAAWGRAALGNFQAAIELGNNSAWTGSVMLGADDYGAIRFPHSDWTLALAPTESGEFGALPDAVHFELNATAGAIRSLEGATIAQGSRAAMVSLVRGEPLRDRLCIAKDERGPLAAVVQGPTLADTSVHFEAALGQAGCPHGDATACIADQLLSSLERHSPGVYGEFCECIGLIRGLETSGFGADSLASFSSPLAPGEMGFNVCYDGERPRLDPFCFTWLGHELGHTRSYLISDAGFAHGWRFLENGDEPTRPIERYGRPLPVRTLFQVPYVHIYELVVLLDYWNGGFAGVPWQPCREAAAALGDDLLAEIDESFDLIASEARLTRLGSAAVAHFHCLAGEAKRRWHKRAA